MKTTNLIQSYTQGYPGYQYNSEKSANKFDVKKELLNRTFIKPLPSNGKLVKNGLLDIPSQFKKDVIYDAKAFSHALKGEANDHELGRLNDVGKKLGGLAIASYLFVKKQTPMTKVFEFIGLGTFFAAMDIWPKLFIQLPAYLIHGVNVRQEYEDSFGRKKMFFSKKIDKIGDRLHVPKDIPNRREFIQEKMRKIALQNNTLWMLTAGFATPLMSALMCNLLEKPVAKYLEKEKLEPTKDLKSLTAKEIEKYDFEKNKKLFDEFIQTNTNKPLTKESFEKLFSIMTIGNDTTLSSGVYKDLKIKLPYDKKHQFNETQIEGLIETIKNAYKNIDLTEEQKAILIPNKETIQEALSNNGLVDGEFADFSEHSKSIQKLLEEKINSIKGNTDSKIVRKLEFALNKLIHSKEYCSDSEMFKAFKKSSAVILTPEKVNMLSELFKSLENFKAEKKALEKFAFVRVGQAPETELADAWNNTSEVFFKAMKFTPEEINKGRLDREFAGAILRNKVEEIVSTQNSYKEFLTKIEEGISSLYTHLSGLDMEQDEMVNPYKSQIKSTYETLSNKFKSLGMNYSNEALMGFGENNATSDKALMTEFINNRKLGVKSSFYRLLNLLDLYHRISTKENIGNALHENMPREIKEECVELAKSLMLEAHSSDYATKFWQRRNPNPNMSDTGDIEVVNGKVKNKFFGLIPEHQRIELSNDREYFKSVMKLMYDEPLHNDTLNLLKKNPGLLSDFKNYRSRAYEVLGGDSYYPKANFLVGYKPFKSTSLERFLTVGCASDDMTYHFFNQTFNSKKWFNMFGKLGIALVGITLLSQFFFGRMKNPNTYSKEGK